MRTRLMLAVSLLGLMFATLPAAAQSNGSSQRQATTPAAAAQDCTCVGTGCRCSCEGEGCVCACDGGRCRCENVGAPEVSLLPGTTVDVAARTLSVAARQPIVVLAGGGTVIPSDLRTTPWQAAARLNALPGVKLGVVRTDARAAAQAFRGRPTEASATGEVAQMAQVSPTAVLSLCVDNADLASALDALSYVSGAAFDVIGSSSAKFTFKTKGTLDQVLAEIGAKAGTTITVIH